jgi:hypothetical protein
MNNANEPNSPSNQPAKPVEPLNYQPRLSPDAQKYERDGWIGLIATIIVCTIAFVLWAIFHKTTDSF